jgi:hypothetical protein
METFVIHSNSQKLPLFWTKESDNLKCNIGPLYLAPTQEGPWVYSKLVMKYWWGWSHTVERTWFIESQNFEHVQLNLFGKLTYGFVMLNCVGKL